MNRRTVTTCIAVLAALVPAGCDTGDGKQLQSYDPADYPSQTVDTTLAPELSSEFDLGGDAGPDIGGVEAFALAAPWLDGGDIDPRHTCDGLDIAPAVSWGAVPGGTVEIALAMVDDSSVSEGQPFVHWVIGGRDPAEIAVAEGDVPPGAPQALNFFGDVGYGGPCPPPGDDAHRYRLTAYALNQQLEIADGTSAADFLATVATLTIASTDLTGFYQRR